MSSTLKTAATTPPVVRVSGTKASALNNEHHLSKSADFVPRTPPSAASLTTPPPPRELRKQKPKIRTREKIEKLVEEGTRNYPAYLKLIYTGDSEQSSEDEFGTTIKKKTTSTFDNRSVGVAGEREAGPQAAVQSQPGGGSRVGEGQVAVLSRVGGVSPESNKLLDPGREKLPTPTVDPGREKLPTPTGLESCQNGGDRRGQKSLTCDTRTHRRDDNDDAADDDVTRRESRDRPQRINQVTQRTVGGMSDEISDQDRVEWRQELLKLQDDIATLKTLLRAKTQVATDLKLKLGITPMNGLKHDFHYGIQSIKESSTFQKTSGAFRSIGASFGAFASRKLGNIRKSNVFKSTEESVGCVNRRHGKFDTSRSENDVTTIGEFSLDADDDDEYDEDEDNYYNDQDEYRDDDDDDNYDDDK